MNRSALMSPRAGLSLIAAGVAALVLFVLMRNGPAQFLDAGSYAAGIDAISHGRGLNTALAPSFSNFSVLEFVARRGSIPFVDFPLGYPLLAAIPALAFGARYAMILVAVLSSAALVGLVTLGPQVAPQPARVGTTLNRALLGSGLVCLPMFQAVTRAGLSEPLFCLLLVAMLKLLLDAEQRPQRAKWAVLVAGLAGAVRFVGLPIIALPALLMLRQQGWRKAWPWALAGLAPATANVLWASAVGSGHVVGVRDISRTDIRFLVHSITGWVYHPYGVFDLLLAGQGRPPWWAYAVVLAVVTLAALAAVSVILGRGWLPRPIELALVVSATLTAGLLGGMLLFDSLVAPDNRLMLPSGVITIVGVGWWASERFVVPVGAAVIASWVVLAVAPWKLGVTHPSARDAYLIQAVGSARTVISDNADSVWWQTGVPAAYLPMPARLLTGEAVDQKGEIEALPCLLAKQQGAIVLIGGPFVDGSAQTLLLELVRSGVLTHETFGTVQRFTPTGAGC